MTVRLFILEGVAGHGLPLEDVLLEENFVIECRLAIDDGHHQESEDGDDMGNGPFQ